MKATARRKLSAPITAPRSSTETRAYQVWLLPQQHQEVQTAISKFNGEWSEWASKAIRRLMREEDAELRSLLGGLRRTDKTSKQRLSFRVREEDFATAQATAKRYKTSIQAVFATAFSMEALAPRLADIPAPANE